MVAVHGYAASAVQLARILRMLRPELKRLIAVDLPGHGFSETPVGVQNPKILLDGVFEALDDIITEPVVLFGNSMGGYIAIQYALHAPQNIRKLVLVSPGGAKMDQRTLDEMRTVFHIDSHRDALDFVDRLLGKPTALRHIMALSVRRRLTRPELLSMLNSVQVDELLEPEDLERLEMPTLCVWGKEDEILPRENVEFFREHLPRTATMLEPDHFGHSPYLEAPRGLADIVLEFVRG